MILVTGATGNVGAELVRALTEQGEPARALVRDAARGAALPDGVERAVGDLNDPASVAAALDGVRGAHLLAGYEGLRDTLARMRDAGVERVTLQSGSSATATDGTQNAVARYHMESEAAIRASGLAWTFLQPNSFMSNTLQWRDQLAQGDTVTAPFADVAVSVIDPRDIAAVAARALTAGDLDGRALRLSGPEALRPADRLEILGEVLGRDLTLRAQSDDEARAEMREAMPEPYVDAFLAFFVDGTIDETTVHPTVEELLGRPPRTFRAWAEEHAGAFR
jgi:uncharacterized protein YbjT (DUF2867 family)